MRRKKSNFTLLEILITLFILSIALTGMGIQGAKLIRQERFERAMDLISEEITNACEIFLLYQNDFSMKFTKEGSCIICSYDMPGSDAIFQKKIGRKKSLAGVDHLFFNGHETACVTLNFSKDHPLSQGEIGFGIKDKKRFFNLPEVP